MSSEKETNIKLTIESNIDDINDINDINDSNKPDKKCMKIRKKVRKPRKLRKSNKTNTKSIQLNESKPSNESNTSKDVVNELINDSVNHVESPSLEDSQPPSNQVPPTKVTNPHQNPSPQPDVDEFTEIMLTFTSLGERIKQHKTEAVKIEADFRKLLRKMNKYTKNLGKKKRKRNPKKNKSKKKEIPKGFALQWEITPILCDFLNESPGTTKKRSEVNKFINKYIKENKLQSTENGTIINCDDKLKKLLNVSDSDKVTFFNIQKLIKPHYIKIIREDEVKS